MPTSKKLYIGIDFETPLTAPGRKAPRVACLTAYVLFQKPQIYDEFMAPFVLERWLRDDNVVLVIQNAKFDTSVILENYPWLCYLLFEKYEKGLIRCLLVNRTLHLIANGTYQTLERTNKLRLNLGHMAKDICGLDVDGKKGDVWRFKYNELVGIPLEEWPQDAVEYAKHDAWLHLEVFDKAQMYDPYPDEDMQTKFAWALNLMYSWGFRADNERVVKLKNRMRKNTLYWGAKLAELGFCTWLDKEQRYKDNQKFIQAEVERQCLELDRPVPRGEITEKMRAKGRTQGNIKYGNEILVDLPCHGGQCEFDQGKVSGNVCNNPLHWISHISADKGELSKYVKHLEAAAKGPVNSFVSTCKATGRTSVSGPPTQQWPRRPGCRESVCARDGYYFIGADYSANEMVTLAECLLDLFGWSRLAELLQNGIQVHDYTGALILGIPYEEFLRRRKAGDKECKQIRQLCKALNFGLPGGMGAEKFVKYAKDSWGVLITVEEAKKYKQQWLSWFPEMRLYFKQTSNQVKAGGGSFRVRQPVSGRLRGGVGYCDGNNTLFQGRAADMTKNALWLVTREMYDHGRWEFHPDPEDGVWWTWKKGAPSPLRGCKGVFFMHDEIILEAPQDRAAAAAGRLRELMEQSSRRYCPQVPGAAEEWMTTHWYKEAEAVFNDQGELTVWQPKKMAA